MNRLLVAYLLLIPVLPVKAQSGSAIPSKVRAVNAIERLSDWNGLSTGEMLNGIPLPEGKVIGDTYYFLDWKRATILLYDGDKLLEDYPARYDIKADELDVKSISGIKVLPGSKIRSFMWIDSLRREPYYFVNTKEFKSDGTVLSGFFEVLMDGKAPLFKKTYLVVKKADYNVQLNVGSPDDKILKETTYYYAQSDQVMEVPHSKKKLVPLFKDKADQVEKYMNENSLSVKDERHLTLIFEYYNSLIKV